MTKKEAQDIAVKFVHDVYKRQADEDVMTVATLVNAAANMRMTGDCTFYINQLFEIRQLIDKLINAMEE